MQHRDICKVSIREEGSDTSTDTSSDEKYARITAVISSGATDSYGTYMTDKTLQNFADRLNEKKVQLKDSHKYGQGFGISESGEFRDGKVIGTFKVMRGWQLNDASLPSSDQYIEGIQEGIITETSVGFSRGNYQCNLCENREWFRDGCYHLPKRSYDIKDKDGKVTRKQCIVGIDDAQLAEVSLVDKGANDDALIMERAQEYYEQGELPVDIQNQLELSYGIRMEGTPINKPKGGSKVETKELQDQLETVKTERDEVKAENAELKPLAECGKEARTYMKGQAKDAYKVSRGESVTESDIERFEKRADTLTFSELVTETEHLRSLAPEKPKVEPGSKTTQPDNSGSRDAKDKTQTRGINPPHWG